jgi:hypothetical protein
VAGYSPIAGMGKSDEVIGATVSDKQVAAALKQRR